VDLWRGSAVMKDNDGPRQAAFVRQAGMRLSAYEHLVPEKLWTDARHPGEAVSAVKALARAAAAGQKIYTLDARNAAALAQIQVDDDARAEIGDALAAGKTVTVHESPVAISGWTGSGYIVADPDTGAGAYKISGGANGSFLPLLSGVGLGASAAASLVLIGLLANFSIPLAGLALIATVATIISVAFYNLKVWTAEQEGCFWQGVGAGAGLVGFLVGASQIAALLNAPYAPAYYRQTLYNMVSAMISSVASYAVGLFAPSNPVNTCMSL
jgi:hypothetical protein